MTCPYSLLLSHDYNQLGKFGNQIVSQFGMENSMLSDIAILVEFLYPFEKLSFTAVFCASKSQLSIPNCCLRATTALLSTYDSAMQTRFTQNLNEPLHRIYPFKDISRLFTFTPAIGESEIKTHAVNIKENSPNESGLADAAA